jgi:hypothetical protein
LQHNFQTSNALCAYEPIVDIQIDFRKLIGKENASMFTHRGRPKLPGGTHRVIPVDSNKSRVMPQ